jgi:acetyl esterase/lipase
MEEKLHPDLRNMFSAMPKMNFDRENLTYTRKQMNEMFVSTTNEPDVRVKIYEPKVKDEILPGVFFIHGGGYIVGNPEQM